MEMILKTLEDTFNKSAGDELKQFLSRYPTCNSCMLVSDYCINDKERPNDVISFVILPQIQMFEDYKNTIKSGIPKDLKHTQIITDKIKEILSSPNYHSFNFIIDKKTPLYNKKTFNQTAINYAVDQAVQMFDEWLKDDPDNELYKEYKKHYKLLKENAKSKSFSFKSYFYSLLTSTIAAFLTHKITIFSNIKNIVWFSDRDAMMYSNNKIFFDNYQIQHNGLARNDSKHPFDETIKLGIGLPEEQGEVWYDEINRLADYCAGAVSGINFFSKTNFSDKANEVLENIILNSTHLIMSHEEIDGKDVYKIIHRKIICEKIEETE